MASPQTENGYTKIANELLEAFSRYVNLSGEENRVFWTIARKTYGFNKKEDAISLSQFVLSTGLLKQNVCRALSNLIKKNMIIKSDKEKIISYRIQKDYTRWTPLSKLIMLSDSIRGVINADNKSLSNPRHTKESKDTKETTTKEKVSLPEWLPKEEFNEYKKMRRTIRKPMTAKAESLAIGKLERLKDDGENPKRVLEQSIMNSWLSLYPLKEQEQETVRKEYNETSNEIVRRWTEEGDEEYKDLAEEILEKRKIIEQNKAEVL